MKHKNNLETLLDNNKKNWELFYSKTKVLSSFPNLNLVRFINEIKNNIETILDIGSGECAQTEWIKNKKIISLDYCKIKNKKIHLFDLRKDSLNINKFKMNSDLIIMSQILDHIIFDNASLISEVINTHYVSNKYIILTFMKSDSWGKKVKGKEIFKGVHLQKISKNSSLKELHMFYNDNQVKSILNIFSKYKILHKVVETYLNDSKKKESNFYMKTEYYLLKRKS